MNFGAENLVSAYGTISPDVLEEKPLRDLADELHQNIEEELTLVTRVVFMTE
jgi:hypothetical protein